MDKSPVTTIRMIASTFEYLTLGYTVSYSTCFKLIDENIIKSKYASTKNRMGPFQCIELRYRFVLGPKTPMQCKNMPNRKTHASQCIVPRF